MEEGNKKARPILILVHIILDTKIVSYQWIAKLSEGMLHYLVSIYVF